ncbi:MAG: M48 family metallopeptidase [Chloroflexota bacterium]
MPEIEITEIVRSKRKTIALVVQPGGRLVVRAPQRATLKQIRAVVERHTAWVEARMKEMESLPAPRTFTGGSGLPYLGQDYPLRLAPGPGSGLRFDGDSFTLTDGAAARAASLFEAWYRRQARKVFTERVRHFAAGHGFEYGKLRISSARTRWGSCSSQGTLSFTWRLVLAPPEVVDYVVVHELVHLRVKNHSPDFWRAVEAILPDYKSRRKWLKANGESLHWP